MDIFFKYFIMFLIYSIAGWLMEVVLTIYQDKKLINRGFLIGPYCPVYGCGILLIISLLKRYTDNFIVLFILAMVICMILEYMTSYFMELFFKARWWDYSKKKYNINGRICLETAIPFGIGGTLIMYVVNPFISGLIDKIPSNIMIAIGNILLIAFIVDVVISVNTLLKFKGVKFKEYKDNTEEITKMVREQLKNYSFFTKRVTNAFPNMKSKIKIKKK